MIANARVVHWSETTGQARCGQQLGPNHFGESRVVLLQAAAQDGTTPGGLACADCIGLVAAQVQRLDIPTRDEYVGALSAFLAADKARNDWIDGRRGFDAPVEELLGLVDAREAALRTLGALAERLPGGVLHALAGADTTSPRPPIDADLIAESELGQESASADPEGTRSALDAGNGGES